jgi:radical SAM protein with 4Fe4S-binding SPASM domain
MMCDIWRMTTRQEIATDDVARWLAEWTRLGVKRVVLTGGEALMHSDIWGLCAALRSAGLGVSILSTGLLLERHASELVRYCDDVVVSLDGPPEVHDTIRNIPSAFAKLARGVRAVKAAGPAVRVSARSTVQRANFRHLRATVEAARSMDLDGISFLAADVSTEAFNREGGWSDERRSEVALAAGELPELEAEIAALETERRADFENGFIAESPAKLRARILQYFRALTDADSFPPITCNAPWVSTVIETDGTVRPCFFHPPLGNVHEAGSLSAVLNAPEAVAWRQNLDIGTDPICRRCVCSLALREGAEG